MTNPTPTASADATDDFGWPDFTASRGPYTESPMAAARRQITAVKTAFLAADNDDDLAALDFELLTSAFDYDEEAV